jgi:hypothetical protein
MDALVALFVTALVQKIRQVSMTQAPFYFLTSLGLKKPRQVNVTNAISDNRLWEIGDIVRTLEAWEGQRLKNHG